MKASPAVTRLSLGLLIFWLVTAFAINGIIHYAASAKYNESTLDHTWKVLKGEGSDDSWGAMRLALDQFEKSPGAPIYSKIFFNDGERFQYPPSSLFALKALDLFGRENVRTEEDMPEDALYANDIAGWIFIVLTVAATAAILELQLAERFGPRAAAFRALRIATVAGLTLTFYPIVKAYSLGQIQVWINALLAAALLSWMLGRKAVSGVLIGALCLLKPHYGLFVLWAMLRREWRFAAACIAIALAGLAAAVAVFGIANHLDYVRVLSFLSERGEVFYPNHSVNGLLNRLMAMKTPSLILEFENHKFPAYSRLVYGGTLLSSALILSLALFRRMRAGAGGSIDFATMALSLTMASPIAWEHHYGVLLPVCALLLARLYGRGSQLWLLALAYAVAATYIQAAQALAPTPYNIFESYLLFTAVAVLALLHMQKDEPSSRGLS